MAQLRQVGLLRGKAAAALARASIEAQLPAAISDAGATQEPPTATTLGCASHCGALSWPMPPVGQNRTCGNGPFSAFSAASPPAGTAGKNFTKSNPRATQAMRSDAVSMPGTNGSSEDSAAANSS